MRSGHPWLFANSVREQNRPGEIGELALIFDRTDKFLGVGLFDPASPIRVRLLHVGKPVKIDLGWWKQCALAAFEKRRNLFDENTNGYRLINGESDGWPGLVLDHYADTLVAKIYTSAWLPRLDEIISLFATEIPNERIVLRLSRNIQEVAQKHFQQRDGQIIRGTPLNGSAIFREHGLRFEADVLRGQKTGFFLDQRENRKIVESLSAARHVLNAFSFSGGFSIYAARGGAKSVTSIDISAHALDSAQQNFALNKAIGEIARCPQELIKADVFAWFREASASKFDLIVLDPPSLAKRESERGTALQAYARLAAAAMQRLSKNGILVAASCSAHVSEEDFFETIRTTGKKSGRNFSELKTTGHPKDHEANFLEANYLKCIYLQMH